jgi:hypothetical protein
LDTGVEPCVASLPYGQGLGVGRGEPFEVAGLDRLDRVVIEPGLLDLGSIPVLPLLDHGDEQGSGQLGVGTGPPVDLATVYSRQSDLEQDDLGRDDRAGVGAEGPS